MNISVVGLGKLGAPLAAVLAHKGHTVVGVDVNPAAVGALNEGRAPVFEPGLEGLLEKNRARLSATTDAAAAVAKTELTFVIVPTPSEGEGGFSLRYVLPAMEAIGRGLRAKRAFHIVALTSTVMPGTTGGPVREALEKASGLTAGRDFGLCYNPEFIALGTVIRDMLNPDFILIGESDARTGEALAALHRATCDNAPPISRMNFVNAELTKLAVNTYVTTKISFANALASVCERLPGADVDVVTSALGMDSRIGRKYLRGALGYGGPCFPRDNLAFTQMARAVGVDAVLAEATDRLNRLQVPRLAKVVSSVLPAGGTVGILGLSYKPDTNVVEEAQGLELARHLTSVGVPTVLYDPAAGENARKALGEGVRMAPTLEACARASHAVVLTTPWNEFKALRPHWLDASKGRPAVIDCWRLLKAEDFESTTRYVRLGLGPGAVSGSAF